MAQGEPVIRIALFDGPRDNDPKPVEIVWDDLVTEGLAILGWKQETVTTEKWINHQKDV